MDKKIAILIAAHKPIPYFLGLAGENPKIDFIVHLDKKTNIDDVCKNPIDCLPNIKFLPNELRVDVKWGGISQVIATLNLLKFAIEKTHAEFFHFISGEDVILSTNKDMVANLSWEDDVVLMECKESSHHRYRARFNTLHANTKHQRTVIGKMLTLLLRYLDKAIPTNEAYYFGSSWFSIKREDLEVLLNTISDVDMEFFERKLCPDEHFFQTIVQKCGLSKKAINTNKRYIVFDKSYNNGNNPKYLTFDELLGLSDKYLFARKVDEDTARIYCEHINL